MKHLIVLVHLIVLLSVISGCSSSSLPSIEKEDKSKNVSKVKHKQNTKNEIIVLEPSPDDKIYTREYLYNASDDDSKNSARRKAIQQIRILLSEEIGTYIESSLDIKNKQSKFDSIKIIQDEIKTVSVAVTNINIIEEKWDGETFFIKANVRVNQKQAIQALKDAVKNKSSRSDIDKLNQLILSQDKKISELNRQITLQEFMKHNGKINDFDNRNLGFLINQKYACIQKGKIKDDMFISIQDHNNILRFYIDRNNILHTEENDSLKNVAPQIYSNGEKKITLYVEKSMRYIILNIQNMIGYSLLLECSDTRFWSSYKK